jgi:Calponin homology (CH) domain
VLSPSSNLGPIYKIDSPQKLPDQVRYEPKPIPETFKEAIIDWFEKLNIIKKDSNSLQLITDVSRTGVLICDLINRIEGKIEIIKGIERNPKNRTQALANINKALEYLRNIPKMNSRYLWSNKEIVDGDEDTIWGLLEDVKSVYYVPIKPKNIQSNTLHTKNISLSSTPLTPLMPLVPPEKTKSPKALKQKNKSMRSYSNKMQSFFSKTSTTTPQITRPSSSRSVKIDSYRADALSVTKVMKKNVDDWVKALGIEYEPQKSGYLNVITNGLLVCELIKMLENEGIRVNSNPKTIQAVQENFEKVFQVLRSKRPEIPSYIISNPENMNNEKAVYSLLYYIMLSYPSAAPVEYKPCYLPYGAVGIRKLEAIIAQWIETLNLVQPPPQCFGELVPELKKGALLCLIASKVTGVKILNIVADPKTDQSSLNNIRKSLEVLRKLPRMSQKFTWSDKDISKGNYSVLLGLLEDLLRWTDGLSCRKNGLEYHKDGPYLRNTILSPIVDN